MGLNCLPEGFANFLYAVSVCQLGKLFLQRLLILIELLDMVLQLSTSFVISESNGVQTLRDNNVRNTALSSVTPHRRPKLLHSVGDLVQLDTKLRFTVAQFLQLSSHFQYELMCIFGVGC
ncbi:hypothetical protein PI87_08680 [Ralstonia sp. A12]|nr:hypothetical protein PI87_08680 [Ralstonia sp. A12]